MKFARPSNKVTAKGFDIMRFIRIIIFAVVGLFLTVKAQNFLESGYLQRWEKLPDSQEVSEYFSIADKSQYPLGTNVKEPCNYSLPEFSLISNSPKNAKDCVQFIMLYPEGTTRYVFVRDNNGNAWQWSHTYILNFYSLIQFPVMGLLTGIIIAIWTQKSNKADKINQPASL